MAEALVWYWKAVEWSGKPGGPVGEKTVAWVEVALDFQAATHMDLVRQGREPEGETMEQRARVMAAMSRRIEVLFKEEVVPGGLQGRRCMVHTLGGMGYVGAINGIRGRPRLLCPRVVQEVLMMEAVRAGNRGEAPSIKSNHFVV